MGRIFIFFTAAMDSPSMLYAVFVFFFLPQAHKIIRVAHKLTRSVGNRNQIFFFFRPSYARPLTNSLLIHVLNTHVQPHI